jgi:hypothetical protein
VWHCAVLALFLADASGVALSFFSLKVDTRAMKDVAHRHDLHQPPRKEFFSLYLSRDKKKLSKRKKNLR